MQKIIDISWPLSERMTTYKNRQDFTREITKSWETDTVRESKICINMHAGTHLDAPAHFLENGSMSEKIPLPYLIGKARVIDLTHCSVITRQDLQQKVLSERVLIKTKNSFLSTSDVFNPSFVYLDESGAQYFVEQGVKLVGIDYLGIERNQPDHQTHNTLLSHSVVILEGLRLAHVSEKEYDLICLPLSITDAEAVPARAVLLS